MREKLRAIALGKIASHNIGVKPDLKDVTLCAACAEHREATARALEISGRHCAFWDAVLFSDKAVAGSFRFQQIGVLGSRGDYSRFIIKELAKHFSTPFVLVAQWDGYVVDPLAWSDEFLQYDYIGPRWAWLPKGQQVGNGGFSLRSRRLMEIMAGDEFPFLPELAEDNLICLKYRGELEQRHQIRFAPPEVADRFAYENINPPAPTFGFHGLLNFWRHVPDEELGPLLDLVPTSVYRHEHVGRLAATYFLHQRWVPLRELYRRWRKHVEFPEAAKSMGPAVPPELFGWCLKACEGLL
jgi:hypothetical protein